MIEALPLLHDTERSRTAYFAGLLRRFYDDLLDQGIPADLAGLVRRIEAGRRHGVEGRRLALVIEADEHLRSLAAALLEETDLKVIECDGVEAALEVLSEHGQQVAFIFADEAVAGMGGAMDLAQRAAERWPAAQVVITTDAERDSFVDLAPAVVTLTKPWRGLDVLIAAERALLSGPERQAS